MAFVDSSLYINKCHIYLYNFLFVRGYVSSGGPYFYTVTNFNTLGFTSLYLNYDLFYKDKGVKIISPKYNQAISLALLIMEDGSSHITNTIICLGTIQA